MNAPIPIWMSRHQKPLPKGYGAFINWKIGEKVKVFSTRGNVPKIGVIKSELRLHPQAPITPSAFGEGQYIYEVEVDGEVYTPSPNQLHFPEES